MNDSMHYYIILGTKAQLVKMAPLMKEIEKRNLPSTFIFTGQHKETVEDMLKEFEINEPDFVLYEGDDITSTTQMLRWMFTCLITVYKTRKTLFPYPGVVLVHGDTMSTFLGALIGRTCKMQVAHIESGLRSFNLLDPFPEEITRLLTFRLSHYLFCPNEWAKNNVKKLKKTAIDCGGNTLIDTLRYAMQINTDFDEVPDCPYAIISVHRYENIFKKERLQQIVEIIEQAARSTRILVILHPPTKKQLNKFEYYSRLDENSDIELRPRYTYAKFIKLTQGAEYIMTDGGSIQEELSYLGLPCLLLRKNTERTEGLGKNIVLSKLESQIISDFIRNHQKLKTNKLQSTNSPSKNIIDWLEKENTINSISS